jgi:hypothetical protein
LYGRRYRSRKRPDEPWPSGSDEAAATRNWPRRPCAQAQPAGLAGEHALR